MKTYLSIFLSFVVLLGSFGAFSQESMSTVEVRERIDEIKSVLEPALKNYAAKDDLSTKINLHIRRSTENRAALNSLIAQNQHWYKMNPLHWWEHFRELRRMTEVVEEDKRQTLILLSQQQRAKARFVEEYGDLLEERILLTLDLAELSEKDGREGEASNLHLEALRQAKYFGLSLEDL